MVSKPVPPKWKHTLTCQICDFWEIRQCMDVRGQRNTRSMDLLGGRAYTVYQLLTGISVSAYL